MSGFLVLWDVDFTLVNTRGAGFQLYRLAFSELYGKDLPQASARANMAGRTDRAISLDVLAAAGIPDPAGEVARFEAALARLAPSILDLVAASGSALPGAAPALAALADPAGPPVLQSLLTGNIRALAEVKLAPFGLARHLDLDIGAYGDESAIRADLVRLARSRARAAYGPGYDGQMTVLIGDTPHDVRAAADSGARMVGVATGHFTAAELAQAGADAVLEDLADTGQVVAAVLGTAAGSGHSLIARPG